MKIGTTQAYATRTRMAYLEDIRVRAAASKTLIEERIAAVDPNPNAEAEERTYQGGCEFLLDWHNDLTSNNENS